MGGGRAGGALCSVLEFLPRGTVGHCSFSFQEDIKHSLPTQSPCLTSFSSHWVKCFPKCCKEF